MTNLFGNSKGIDGYLTAFGGIAPATLFLALVRGQINSTALALALLLVVQVIATVFGSRPALLASLLGVLSFNFFFLPPLYTFTIAEPQNWIAFGAFLVTAIIAGQLSSYARRQTEESERRRREIERLYDEMQAAFEQASQAEAFRRVEAGALTLRKSWSGVRDIIDNAVERAKNRLDTNFISIEIERELPVVSVDAETHQVFVRGAEVHLTPKEFDLLVYLIKKPGKSSHAPRDFNGDLGR